MVIHVRCLKNGMITGRRESSKHVCRTPSTLMSTKRRRRNSCCIPAASFFFRDAVSIASVEDDLKLLTRTALIMFVNPQPEVARTQDTHKHVTEVDANHAWFNAKRSGKLTSVIRNTCTTKFTRPSSPPTIMQRSRKLAPRALAFVRFISAAV